METSNRLAFIATRGRETSTRFGPHLQKYGDHYKFGERDFFLLNIAKRGTRPGSRATSSTTTPCRWQVKRRPSRNWCFRIILPTLTRPGQSWHGCRKRRTFYSRRTRIAWISRVGLVFRFISQQEKCISQRVPASRFFQFLRRELLRAGVVRRPIIL